MSINAVAGRRCGFAKYDRLRSMSIVTAFSKYSRIKIFVASSQKVEASKSIHVVLAVVRATFLLAAIKADLSPPTLKFPLINRYLLLIRPYYSLESLCENVRHAFALKFREMLHCARVEFCPCLSTEIEPSYARTAKVTKYGSTGQMILPILDYSMEDHLSDF
jgi:hypothetical protein